MKEVFCGLSTDTKPTGVPDGSEYIEVNTRDIYIFYNGTWYKQKDKVLSKLETKQITITENETKTYSPSEGKIGFSTVEITTNVSGSGIDLNDYFDNSVGSGNSANNGLKAFVKLIKKIKTPISATNTDLNYTFNQLTSLTEAPEISNISSVTSVLATFNGCTSLTTAPSWNTSNVTNFASFLNGCTALTTVPVYDMSSVSGSTALNNMVNGCTSLSSTSLDNLLQSCASTTVAYTGTKTLATLGITSTDYPSATIQSLPHYNDFITAGWTIGY